MKCGTEIILYQFSFLYEFNWNLEIFLESIYLSLITISMNLFDQLVIIICDSVMEG